MYLATEFIDGPDLYTLIYEADSVPDWPGNAALGASLDVVKDACASADEFLLACDVIDGLTRNLARRRRVEPSLL